MPWGLQIPPTRARQSNFFSPALAMIAGCEENGWFWPLLHPLALDCHLEPLWWTRWRRLTLAPPQGPSFLFLLEMEGQQNWWVARRVWEMHLASPTSWLFPIWQLLWGPEGGRKDGGLCNSPYFGKLWHLHNNKSSSIPGRHNCSLQNWFFLKATFLNLFSHPGLATRMMA